jgi:hypothetical protein
MKALPNFWALPRKNHFTAFFAVLSITMQLL